MQTKLTAGWTMSVMAALWLGAALFLAIFVAPAAFSVLPSRAMAGDVIGRLLPVLFITGIALGAAVLVVEVRERGRRHGVARTMGGLLVIAACLIAQVGIAPRISRLRDTAGVPIDSLAADSVIRQAFGRLHMQSVVWLGVAMLAALSVVLFNWLAMREMEVRANTE